MSQTGGGNASPASAVLSWRCSHAAEAQRSRKRDKDLKDDNHISFIKPPVQYLAITTAQSCVCTIGSDSAKFLAVVETSLSSSKPEHDSPCADTKGTQSYG